MKLLLYCTKAKPYLTRNDLPNEKGEFYKHYQLGGELDKKHLYGNTPILNGKIVAECDYEVEEIRKECVGVCKYCYRTKTLDEYDLMYKTQLDGKSMNEYLQGKGYAIHIKNLHIFDKPKELSDYYIKQCQFGKCSTCEYGKNNIICSTIDTPITKAPQNMMYAYDNEWNRYILTSIRPEWLCEILNGEKTIEVRKKVLKEMMK